MANGIENASYDPKKVSVIINGKEITGFGTDSVISVTRNEDIVTTQVGVPSSTQLLHGSVAKKQTAATAKLSTPITATRPSPEATR